MTIASPIARPIARPIASPLDGSGGGGAIPWSPTSMFAASEIGGYYDPSIISSLWQDAAGTTPVTADGQPVGKMADLSGNGNHWTSSGTARPTYHASGGKYWLQFDGVDDQMTLASRVDLYDLTVGAAFSIATGGGSIVRGLMGWTVGSTSSYFCSVAAGLTLPRFLGYTGGVVASAATALSTTSVLTVRRINSTGVGTCRQNGVQKAAFTTYTGFSIVDALYRMGANFADGKLYGLVMCGASVSDAQQLELESFLAGKI